MSTKINQTNLGESGDDGNSNNESLEKLKHKLKDLPKKIQKDTSQLIRFLVACNGNVNDAEKMFRDSLVKNLFDILCSLTYFSSISLASFLIYFNFTKRLGEKISNQIKLRKQISLMKSAQEKWY